MSLFKGNERTEVSRWIVDLENLLDEMGRSEVADREISESRDALSWLRRLVAAD